MKGLNKLMRNALYLVLPLCFFTLYYCKKIALIKLDGRNMSCIEKWDLIVTGLLTIMIGVSVYISNVKQNN